MTAMGGPTGPEVVVVGAIGINTNVFCAEQIDLSREGYFTNNNDYVGQAGGYSSRGFARLGLRTAFVGHVGNDRLGTWIRSELAGDGTTRTQRTCSGPWCLVPVRSWRSAAAAYPSALLMRSGTSRRRDWTYRWSTPTEPAMLRRWASWPRTCWRDVR